MTMATNITKEEDNFLRIVYLNYRVGTKALRRYFDNVHPNLPSDLSSPTNKSILAILHKPPRGQRRVLYQEQWDILYPPSGSHVVSSADLDVTLMVCLLRNLPPKVNPPINGFDALPQSTDLSRGAHIARIKYYKNFLVSHSKDGKISDTDFNTIWIDLEMAIIGLGNQHDVKDAAEAKSKSLDYNSLQELVHIDTRLNYHTNEIAKQTSKIEKLETTVEAMEKDFMVERITRWEKDDILYIETRATKHVLSCVSKYKCVSVIGPSGCGKMALVRHVALQLKRNGYTILTVSDAKQIKEYYQSERKTMYIVDDMCGNFTANQARLDEWKKSKTDIEEMLQSGNCKLVLTCRLQVFQDKGFENLKIFKTCICNITSTDLSLTSEEKQKMTTKYFGDHAIKALGQLGKYDFLPFLCKLYHAFGKGPHFKLEKFLDEPFSFYDEHLTFMYNDCIEGKYKYCALLLLVIFNNKLEEKHLTGKHSKVTEIIEDIIEKFEIDEHITGRKLKAHIEILTGTFVTYEDGIYQTIHDKLFDFLAYYFGKQNQNIDILIQHAKDKFVLERFVVTNNSKRTQYFIPISSDKLQLYMKRVFADIVSSCNVVFDIFVNKNLKNVKFRAMLCDFMEHLAKHEIIALMEKANIDFLNKLFVRRKTDIKDQVRDPIDEYKCFGVILTDDVLQQYIEKWFTASIGTKYPDEQMKNNRLFKCVTFRTALKSYLIRLNTENVAAIIHTGSKNFLNTMIVMAEDETNDFVKNQNERFGIVIPKGMLQNYIDRWFDDLTKYVGENNRRSCTYYVVPFSKRSLDAKTWMVTEFINENRPLENFAFCYALRTYINQLTTEKIASLIHTAKDSFLNTMFVMSHDDIKDNAENRYEWFGIVIPDDLLQQYIVKYFDGLTNKFWLVDNIHINRVFNNVKGRIALQTHMKQINREKIASLIQNSTHTFFNKMFVIKEEDIQNKQYNSFCIVIPDDMLQQYIKRWLEDLTKTLWVKEVIDENSSFINVTFRNAVRHYIRELTIEKISSIIQTANCEFIDLMFVMSEEDINDNSKNRYKCIGIVIPDDLLQQYIKRWLYVSTKDHFVFEKKGENRPSSNITFRSALCTYIRQLTTEEIAFIIQTTSKEFLLKHFVMTEEDFKDNSGNRLECFGIVIPTDLLQQFVERWFESLSQTWSVQYFMRDSRFLNNVIFRISLCNYMRQLNTEKIGNLIWNANENFINTMFVLAEEDIKGYAVNQYDFLSIVIPDDLLQQYIERWFECLTKTYQLETYINEGRLIKNVTFRTALGNYMRQINSHKIASLIWNTDIHFINTMFVMSEADVKDNAENLLECFGIVIPDDLLQQYIERLYEGFTDTCFFITFGRYSRLLKNVKFRTSLCDYMRQLNTEKIAYLIWKTNMKFINTMFVMSEEDIKDNSENPYECFGIVIPKDLLQQFIERWFKGLTETWDVEGFMGESRVLKNVIFRTSLCDYMRQLNTEKIASLIWNADVGFINTMFVIAEKDIKDNSENQYECFGIVIPKDLLQQFIERWFNGLTKTVGVEGCIRDSRVLKNVIFRTSLCDYMRQLNTEKIASLILNAHKGFINTMFVIAEIDIKDNVKNLYESFGIVIPKDLLQQFIERWFKGLTETNRLETYINKGRSIKNATFRTALANYMKHLNKEKIASLILNAHEDFINTMFVIAEIDIKDNVKNLYECFGIVIPKDLLQQFIERWFKGLTETWSVEKFMGESRVLKNVIFRTSLCDYMRQLNTEKIASLILFADEGFINTMFVIAEKDIKDNSENQYECFGIVIPEDLLQQFIERWFKGLTETWSVEEFIGESRVLKNVIFLTSLCDYMRQLNTEKIASLIWNAHNGFINTMFVIAEKDIKDNSENQYECFGIVIPNDLLLQFIERWFKVLTETWFVEEFIGESRVLKNVIFRTSLCDYMRQLNTEKIASLILNADKGFINTMFVIAEKDIKDNSENQYECFGIVIPKDLLQQFIERWFKDLTETWFVEQFIGESRVLKNVIFRNSLCDYIRQLNTEKIASLILNAHKDFIKTIFVMAEKDIRDNSENRYECFGIVIPDDLLQQYIERCFKCLTETYHLEKYIGKNRPTKNVSFRIALNEYIRQFNTEIIASLIWNAGGDFINTMFVIKEEDIKDNSVNRYECFGIVIPDDLLHQYIERWFDRLTKTNQLEEYIGKNRPIKNVTFRIALNEYMRQFNTEKIASLIWNANGEFINTMFVMAKEDINDKSENRFECFGIVIPDDLLHQYIERWFQRLTKTSDLEKVINKNRPIKNVTFRIALDEYMRQFNTEKIASLIWNANGDFINTMFVMAKEDINDKSENRFECFGIVIPDDLLHQYIERWFQRLTKTSDLEKVINKNRPIKNVTFRIALDEYMRQFNTEKIASLIWNANGNFINTMYVMAKEDIKDNTENRFECFGIVILDDLLQQYVERLFQRLTKTSELEKYIDKNRPIKNVLFRTALCNYIRQANREKIASLIWSANGDFINTMFVMSEEDIKDNSENRYECFGIVIPDDLLHQYIERWFDRLTKTNQLEEYIGKNRPIKNVTFRIALNEYMRQFNTEKIASLIWNANGDFINTMFVMAKEDINDKSENRFECFGIVIPDDLLHQYIERWFQRLTKTSDLEKVINKNRPIKNVTFRIALDEYMRQFNTEKIASLIWNANGNFINTMYVMAKEDIKDNTENRFECFGIVIPADLIQQYVERWFQWLTKASELENFINKNRPLKNISFRFAFSDYLKQLITEKIASLIWNVNADFINIMFVMAKEDINNNAENRYECFGIVIPDDLIQQYIKRLFECFTKTSELQKYIEKNRPIQNVSFRIAFSDYMGQLNRGKIASLILNENVDFINTMFVMTEDDIKDDNAEHRFECFGIILPDGLLQHYIGRLFDGLSKSDSVKNLFDANRSFRNETFQISLRTYTKQLSRGKVENFIQTGSRDFINTMFVMTDDDMKENFENRLEYFGIILPDDLLQQYISRLVDGLTKTDSVCKCLGVNRCFMNTAFQISLQTYIKQLTQGNITNLIWTGSRNFVNTMFVIAEDDIKEDSENRLECFGIILPDNLLYQYIERWFGCMTKTDLAKQYIDGNRTFTNSKFQANLDTYINGINAEKIALLNRKGHIDYLNTRRDLLKENSTS